MNEFIPVLLFSSVTMFRQVLEEYLVTPVSSFTLLIWWLVSELKEIV